MYRIYRNLCISVTDEVGVVQATHSLSMNDLPYNVSLLKLYPRYRGLTLDTPNFDLHNVMFTECMDVSVNWQLKTASLGAVFGVLSTTIYRM